MEKKINNLLDMKEFSEKEFMKDTKTTKRTDVAKDVIKENAYVLGKDVFNEKPKTKEDHVNKQLNNLISLDDFTKSVPSTDSKATKRTEVAKDVIKENAYVLGKNVFNDKSGGEAVGLPPKTKEDHTSKLNNIISLDDFTKNVPSTGSKKTKRTEVAKDILLEKAAKTAKKAKKAAKKAAKAAKKAEECKDDKKKEESGDEPKKGLTAGQKKLPPELQVAILKRQGK